VFGRGGEEGEALRAAGIEFEVVPGVTAGVAATTYAGIPVTHRDDASAVAFVTGHEDPEKSETALDWQALAAFPGTSGFFSKDEILAYATARGGMYLIFTVLGYLGALLTAIYTFRLIFRVLPGRPCKEAQELIDTGHVHHAHPFNPATGEEEDTGRGDLGTAVGAQTDQNLTPVDFKVGKAKAAVTVRYDRPVDPKDLPKR
jgi:hypothetical protein